MVQVQTILTISEVIVILSTYCCWVSVLLQFNLGGRCEYCGHRGICSRERTRYTMSLQTKCKCEPGFVGEHCQYVVCSNEETTIDDHCFHINMVCNTHIKRCVCAKELTAKYVGCIEELEYGADVSPYDPIFAYWLPIVVGGVAILWSWFKSRDTIYELMYLYMQRELNWLLPDLFPIHTD